MLDQGIHALSPEQQIYLMIAVWFVTPVLYVTLSKQMICKPAQGWWILSLPVYVIWLAFNNPIVSSYLGV